MDDMHNSCTAKDDELFSCTCSLAAVGMDKFSVGTWDNRPVWIQ